MVAALTALAAPAAAQVAATVEGVQMPAWVERDGRRMPLVPGMQLRAGDEVHAGGGSRIVIKLAEGSVVKLGENGRLRFTELSPTRELFKAALNVLEGAFRFTTELVAKERRREVSIRVSQVTAGIRGTDIWGRSRPGNEIVCLIEGEVEVAAQGEPPLTMNKPLQFYRRVQGATQPVGVVEPRQLEQWARETDLEAGKGAARQGGRWSVLAATVDDQRSALELYDRLRNAGYAAEIQPTREGLYNLRIRQLASQADAEALAEGLRGKHGVVEPLVAR
ncbi:MAG: FecR domain-containing protein [Betaproteobacteria bacterium]|nr:FecR domain-containing protein [Betaproteobacteria bacterium]